jgi:hypothetical protein
VPLQNKVLFEFFRSLRSPFRLRTEFQMRKVSAPFGVAPTRNDGAEIVAHAVVVL